MMQVSRWLTAPAVAFVLAVATAIPQSAQARGIVGFSGEYSAGTVVVRTNERSLYYVLGGGKAMRYPVGVGRAGKQWSGTTFINGKMLRPAWVPPAVVRRDKPNLPSVVPAGAPNNPVGAAVLFLAANAPFTARIIQDRSAGLCPMAAFECITRTCSISMTVSASEPK